MQKCFYTLVFLNDGQNYAMQRLSRTTISTIYHLHFICIVKGCHNWFNKAAILGGVMETVLFTLLGSASCICLLRRVARALSCCLTVSRASSGLGFHFGFFCIAPFCCSDWLTCLDLRFQPLPSWRGQCSLFFVSSFLQPNKSRTMLWCIPAYWLLCWWHLHSHSEDHCLLTLAKR